MSEMDTVGKRLRALLEHKDMSQEELALRMGVEQGDVSAWCTGRAMPPISRGITISKNLHVPLDWLYGTIDNAEYITAQDARNLFEAMNKTSETFKQRRDMDIPRYVDRYVKPYVAPLSEIIDDLEAIDAEIAETREKLAGMMGDLVGATPESERAIRQFERFWRARHGID